MPRPPVGLVGVGLLGTALAERLLAAGHPVVGWDLDPARRTHLAALGGTAAASAREAFRCDRVLLSLPNSNVVWMVVSAVESHLRPGQLIIDTTTGAPDKTAGLGARLTLQGIGYLDATVSGSSDQARAGEVTAMVGGTAKDLERARDVLAAFAKDVIHVGPCGAGARLKLVTNLVLGLNRAALAEGLAFAGAIGVAPAKALEVLRSSAAYSSVMDAKGRKMVERDFAPQAKLDQHLKDVRLILTEATRRGAVTPLSEMHAVLLEGLVEKGLGDADNSAIVEAFRAEQRAAAPGAAETDLSPYYGKFVAWDRDRSHVVASGDDDWDVARAVRESGRPLDQVSFAYIPHPDQPTADGG